MLNTIPDVSAVFLFFRSGIFHHTEELNRVHKDISLECNQYRDNIHDLLNEFRKGYRLAVYALRGAVVTGGIGVVLSLLSFFVIDDEVSDIFAGAGTVVSVVAVLCVAFGLYRKTRQEKKLKRAIEVELKGFQDNTNLIIDMLENIFQSTEEILRDPSLSVHKTQALSEHFACCFEKSLFQEHDTSKVVSKMDHFSGKLSEMISKVNSVPDILKEIIEDNKRQRGKPATPTKEQIHKREFKEKANQFINNMQKVIRELKHGVKKIIETTDSISNIL